MIVELLISMSYVKKSILIFGQNQTFEFHTSISRVAFTVVAAVGVDAGRVWKTFSKLAFVHVELTALS